MSGLTNAERSHLARAAVIAKQSTMRQRHGSLISSGKRILAVGVNSFRSHPTHVTDPKRQASFHAEVAAIRQLGYDNKDTRLVLYVARVNKADEAVMSMPCPACRDAIRAAGIRKVVYTVENGGWGVMSL